MKKILTSLFALLFFLAFLPPLFADSPQIKQRKQNLTELEKKLKVQKEKEMFLSKETTGRRKEQTVSVSITHEDLTPMYDAQNKITGYSFSLHQFFDKAIDKEPKDFYYPLQIFSLKIHYQGNAVATIGYCGPTLHAGLYSDFKFGNGRFLFTNKQQDYSENLFIYFETNDKMQVEIALQYLGIDSIEIGGTKHWENDLNRLAPFREQFYKAVPAVPGQEKEKSLFNQLINVLTQIKGKYDQAGPEVRRVIDQNYISWMARLEKMMKERNQKIETVVRNLEDLRGSTKAERASFSLNEIIQREYALEKELKEAIDTTQVENYLQSILREIENAEKGK